MGKIGKWNEIEGLTMNEMESKFEKRHNLEGLTFVSTITVIMLNMTEYAFQLPLTNAWYNKIEKINLNCVM